MFCLLCVVALVVLVALIHTSSSCCCCWSSCSCFIVVFVVLVFVALLPPLVAVGIVVVAAAVFTLSYQKQFKYSISSPMASSVLILLKQCLQSKNLNRTQLTVLCVAFRYDGLPVSSFSIFF